MDKVDLFCVVIDCLQCQQRMVGAFDIELWIIIYEALIEASYPE
jgi:hypothetical protein